MQPESAPGRICHSCGLPITCGPPFECSRCDLPIHMGAGCSQGCHISQWSGSLQRFAIGCEGAFCRRCLVVHDCSRPEYDVEHLADQLEVLLVRGEVQQHREYGAWLRSAFAGLVLLSERREWVIRCLWAWRSAARNRGAAPATR